MKGVLSPSRGSYLQQNRFQSPQPQMGQFIMLPSFDKDRGRRKISKMGGLASMFSMKPKSVSPKKSKAIPKKLKISNYLS